MGLRKISYPIIGSILLLAITGCEKQLSGPEIEWLGGTTTTYSYSGGVRTGANFYLKFNVIDEQSGNLIIEATIGSTTKSCSAFVESGKEYKLVVSCAIGKEDSSSTLVLDVSSSADPLEVPVTGYSVTLKEVEIRES